jgi:predicted TIM-barrel fold metal-dependent hydrolase
VRVFGEAAGLLRKAGADPEWLAALEGAIVADGDARVGRRADAHVHLGRDRDGHTLAPDELLEDMARWQIGRAVVFALNDHGRDGDFADANRAVIAAAAAAPGRLVPFCRVAPQRGALAAIEAAAAAGARGLKLHPVAQGFAPESPAAIACVAAATARGWPVLVHAGYGARPLADALASVVDAVPGARLVLAHGARGDARAVCSRLADHPGIWFDTSLAALPDLVGLPPERLLFGSDRPYGDYATALQLVGLSARIAGWSDEQLAGVLAGNLASLVGADDAGA